MTGYLLEIKNEIALIFCYRKIKTFYYIVQHGISGYGFLQKPPLKLLRNFRYAETLCNINLLPSSYGTDSTYVLFAPQRGMFVVLKGRFF